MEKTSAQKASTKKRPLLKRPLFILYLFYAAVAAAFLLFLWSSQMSTSTEQKNILEYVPIAIPINIASTKSFVVTPPKKYNAASVIIVVSDVLILLAKVWLTDALTISPKDIFFE